MELIRVCGNCSFVDAEKFEDAVFCIFDGHHINSDDKGCDKHHFIPAWKRMIENPSLIESAADQQLRGYEDSRKDDLQGFG